MTQTLIKPIIKWAGGKRNIMHQLLKLFPHDFGNYHEPFLGGASVVFELFNNNILKDKICYLSDISKPLVNLYFIVKTQLHELENELSKNCYLNTKEQFLINRIRFNNIKKMQQPASHLLIEMAALFVYLNRTCFNGMYRENRKGEYNVPYGSQKNPTIFNKDLFYNVSSILQDTNIIISNDDYSCVLDNVKDGDFIYMDPPYYNTFTDYTNEPFGKQEQIQLKECFDKLSNNGCLVALSNSNDPFIRDLYSDYYIHEINVKRCINSKASERATVIKEILITNYIV